MHDTAGTHAGPKQLRKELETTGGYNMQTIHFPEHPVGTTIFFKWKKLNELTHQELLEAMLMIEWQIKEKILTKEQWQIIREEINRLIKKK